jgi:hypothetical protein
LRAAVTATLSGGVGYYIVVWEAGTQPPVAGQTTVQLRLLRLDPPAVTTLPNVGLTATGIVVHAQINPQGAATTAWFEWGTDTGYGNSTPVQTLGNGANDMAVSAVLTGLSNTNTYHYRAVASSGNGINYGEDRVLMWISVARLPNGNCHIEFVGSPGQSYDIEACSDLHSWQTIGTATDLGNGRFEFADAGGLPARFYRVRLP